MKPETISADLEALPRDDYFAHRTDDLVLEWERRGAGSEAVEPILRFMEQQPDIDFGVPGALVHFVERFDGYDDMLLASVGRQPTPHTVWMLNRVINATVHPATRGKFIAAMRQAASHPRADPDTKASAADFLKYQGEDLD